MSFRKKVNNYFRKDPYTAFLVAILILLIIITSFIFLIPTITTLITNLTETDTDKDYNYYYYDEIPYDFVMYVHKDGDNSNGETWETAYSTINIAFAKVSVDLDDKTIIFVGLGLFDVNVAYQLNITKNVKIVGSGRDATIFTNTHVQAEFVFNVTRYFKMEHCGILYSSTFSGINVYGDDSDVHLNHVKFIDDSNEEEGYYPTTYSFTDDTIGEIADGFVIENLGGTANVIDTLDGHDMVLDVFDTEGADFLRVTQMFTAGGQESGTIEWWDRVDDANLDSHTQFRDSDDGTGFLLGIRLDDFYWYDGGFNYLGIGALDDTWYHIRIDFECGAGGYMGLAADTYYFWVDGVRYGSFAFWWAQTDIDNINFQSDAAPNNYHHFVDALDYSWEMPSALQIDYGREGEYEDMFFQGEGINSVAINLLETTHNHFRDIQIHECTIGIRFNDENVDDNYFEKVDFHRNEIGIDLDAGNEQHFDNLYFCDMDYNVDDEIGDSYWYNIHTEIEEAISTPQDMVGIDVDDGGAGIYGLDVLIYDASASDRPYYVVAVGFRPDAQEVYSLRLTENGGTTYFYETVLEARIFNQIDRFTIEFPRVFNAHSQIHCSVRSVSGGKDMDVWLEIVII